MAKISSKKVFNIVWKIIIILIALSTVILLIAPLI